MTPLAAPPRLPVALRALLSLLLLASLAGCGFDVTGLAETASHDRDATTAVDPGQADPGQADPGTPDEGAPDTASDPGGDEGQPDLPPEVALPDDDGDGVPNGDDLCPQRVDPTNLDADGDTAGDVCDECPFVEGAGACPSGKWAAAHLAGAWMVFRVDPVAGGAPYLRDLVTLESAGADVFKVKLGVELLAIGQGTVKESGHVWVGVSALPGSPPAVYQGVVSRLGDKVFLQRVDAEGRALPELMVLLRQPRGAGLTTAAYVKAHPPAEGEPYLLSGLLRVDGSAGGGSAGLLQTATFGAVQVNAIPIALSSQTPFEADRIRLLTPDGTASLTINPAALALKLPQADKISLTVRVLTTVGGLLTVPQAVDVPLEGTFSYFGDLGLFVGERQNVGGADLTLLIAFLRVFKNPLSPEDLNLPFSRLGVADARGTGTTVRSSLVDPNGPGRLDVLSLVAGAGADPHLCLTSEPPQWSFAEMRNPLGHVFQDDCLGMGGTSSGGTDTAYAYAWMGAVRWGTFPVLPDMGLGVFAPGEMLYKSTAAWPGLVIYAASPALGGLLDHYDADMDGVVSGSAATACNPITLPVVGGDACPCVVGKEDKEDGCR